MSDKMLRVEWISCRMWRQPFTMEIAAMTDISQVHKALDLKQRRSDRGGQYWMGRDIQEVLGYVKWDSFIDVTNKAQKACESIGIDPRDHFLQTEKMIEVGRVRWCRVLISSSRDTPVI